MNLFICPLPPPIHGQAKVSEDTINLFNEKLVLDINYVNKSSIQKVCSFIGYLIKLLYFFLRFDINKVYLSISRSKFGALRDLPVLLLGYITDIKIIGHVHGGDFDTFILSLKPTIRKLMVSLYSRCNSIVFPMEEIAEEIENKIGIRNTIVIPNYLKNFEKYEYNLNSNGTSRILFMSNILETKGIYEFLDIIAGLKKISSDLDVRVAGNFLRGYELEKKTVLKSHEQGLIKYLGFIDNEIKTKELKECDFFILPSYSEAFPLVILEAMASGCIIITSDRKYHKYLIDESFGRTFDFQNNINTAINFILTLMNDPNRMKEMKKNAIEIAQKYSFEKYSIKITKLVNES